MYYIVLIFRIVIVLIFAAFLHYTLPQTDIARVTDTYQKRIDFGENSLFWASADAGNAATPLNRDVFFISVVRANGRLMVYRNEDTGWGWPPYFKFDTSNLQAEAADMKSTVESPKWVAVRHYGWRFELFSIFPNAISVWQVDGPNVRIIPWINIVILTVLFAIIWAVRVRWVRFRENRINPVIDEWTDGLG